MNKVASISKSIVLLVALSIVYAVLEGNVIFLLPIVTIALPYKFMKNKDNSKVNENKKVLNNLYIFNVASFAVAVVITKNINTLIFDIIFNIVMAFIYYKIMSIFENKRDEVFNNPQKVYDKINNKIQMLEAVYAKAEDDLNSASDEKTRNSIQSKLDTINDKISELRKQLDLIKNQVELKNKKENSN